MFQSKPYSLELPGETSESCLQARALFVETILQLRPHVVSELWKTALPEFKRLQLGVSNKDRVNLDAEYRNWATVKKGAHKELAVGIQGWSERWNLNADWCRDFALSVLRHWFSHPRLGFVNLHRSALSIQARGWSSGANEFLYSALRSRVNVTRALDSAYPLKSFRFGWPCHDFERDPITNLPLSGVRLKPTTARFERPGYNILKESQNEYNRRIRAEFELFLNERRRTTLISIVNGTIEGEIKPRAAVIKAFGKALDHHVKNVVTVTAEASRALIKTKARRELKKHVTWAVEFQVPPFKTLDEIINLESTRSSRKKKLRDTAISQRVNEILALIGLGKRKQTHKGGRTPGSKNKQLGDAERSRRKATGDILRKLGH